MVLGWSRPHFSPDGGRLAAVSSLGGVSEFELSHDLAGRTIALPSDLHAGRVLDLAYDASGNLLVLLWTTNFLSVWDVPHQSVVAQRPLHVAPDGGLLSRDGQRAVVYFREPLDSTNTTVGVVNWAGHGEITDLQGHHNGIRCLAISGDGNRVATLDGSRVSRLWDTATNSPLTTMPKGNHRSVGLALDRHGDAFALSGQITQIQRRQQEEYQPSASVPNAAPKPTTFLGGVGLLVVEVAVGAAAAAGGDHGSGSGLMWDPNWFKSAPTLGVGLTDQGDRIAILNQAPNLKGGFQVRFANARTGCPEASRGLPSQFRPWGVFFRGGDIWSLEFPGDRTGAQPVFSPDCQRLAVAGDGIWVMDCGSFSTNNPNDLWLARPASGHASAWRTAWSETPPRIDLHSTHTPNPASPLARNTHRRVCVERPTGVCGQVWGEIPLGLGQTKESKTVVPIELALWDGLRHLLQADGQTVVHWDEELALSSRVLRWHLDSTHSLTKGWDLEGTLEIEVTLADLSGKALHTGHYQSKAHETRLWQPSDKFLLQMQGRLLNACLADMENDPKWEQALANRLTTSR